MSYEECLRKLGLSNNETKVYIALLELGTSKVDSISRRVPFPRTTIYGIIKSLLAKGLVSYVIKSGVKHYEATDPARLLSMEEEKIGQLRKIMPELNALKSTISERPCIEMYEGKEGIKSVYEDMLRTKKTIYGYGTTRFLYDLMEHFVPNYMQRRVRLGIKSYIITEMSKSSLDMKKNDKRDLRETRFIDRLKNTAVVVYLYGDKTAIIEFIRQHPIGIIINNKELNSSQKIIFDLMWESAKL